TTASAAVQHAHDANFVVSTGRNIVVNSGTGWTSTAGNLSFSANQQATPTSGNFIGIDVNNATIGSSLGAITLQGRGGNDAGGSQFGVYLHGGAVVGSAHTRPVSLTCSGHGPHPSGLYIRLSVEAPHAT